jgi:hypothetical protein
MLTSGLWLDRNSGKLVGLRVDIPKHSTKLHRYLTWAKKHEAVILDENDMARCNDAGEVMTTWNAIGEQIPCAAQWYIHFGDIPPRRIIFPET